MENRKQGKKSFAPRKQSGAPRKKATSVGKSFGSKRPRIASAGKESFSKNKTEKPFSDRKEFDNKKPRTSFSDKPSFGKRPERTNDRGFDKRKPRTSFSDKPSFERKSEGSSERRFDKRKPRPSFSDKPSYGRKSEGSGERSFDKRKPRTSFSDKPSFERKSERTSERTFGKKTAGSRVERVKERFAEKKKAIVEKGVERSRNTESKGRKDKREKPSFKKGYQKSYEKKRKEEPENAESFSGKIRLNKYLSNAGVASRREADELITAGLVSVNGKVVTELGAKIKAGDDIRFNNERLSTERKVYLIMNKPKDTITTLDDPDKRRIVTDLLIGHDLPRVYPIGRLDRNTTGVLLLTNDGELSERLMHPKYGIQKVYKATLNKNFKGEHLWELANGLELEDGFMKPDAVLMPDPATKNEVVVELHSGKNRIVHRLFEALGYTLDKLDRVVYCGFNKKSLKRGEWRELNAKEVSQLKKQVKL